MGSRRPQVPDWQPVGNENSGETGSLSQPSRPSLPVLSCSNRKENYPPVSLSRVRFKTVFDEISRGHGNPLWVLTIVSRCSFFYAGRATMAFLECLKPSIDI